MNFSGATCADVQPSVSTEGIDDGGNERLTKGELGLTLTGENKKLILTPRPKV